jgi:hypothetical protein
MWGCMIANWCERYIGKPIGMLKVLLFTTKAGKPMTQSEAESN